MPVVTLSIEGEEVEVSYEFHRESFAQPQEVSLLDWDTNAPLEAVQDALADAYWSGELG